MGSIPARPVRCVDHSRPKLRFVAAFLSIGTVIGSARAQLTPDRTYYGVGRAVPMTVNLPADAGPTEPAEVLLLAASTAQVRARSKVAAGSTDLAAMFPALWDTTVPHQARDVQYAQLVIGDRRIGPAVVLVPLVEPDTCVFIETQTQEPQYRPARPFTFSGLRAYVEQHVVMETSLGDIEFRMRPDQAPNTVWNFMKLVRGGFYTDINFHRIVALNESNRKPFVIQGGDPIFGHATKGVGEGGPGYQINLEKSALPHDFGVISMARGAKLPNSGGSQFFIGLSREGTSHLDGQFAAFGQAVSGAEVIRNIAAVPVDQDGRPRDPVVIRRCRLLDAPPYDRGPAPVVAPNPAPLGR